MARVRVQQGCCARAHRDMLTASLGTLAQWPSSRIELISNKLYLVKSVDVFWARIKVD
jgi:hypothetical protein